MPSIESMEPFVTATGTTNINSTVVLSTAADNQEVQKTVKKSSSSAKRKKQPKKKQPTIKQQEKHLQLVTKKNTKQNSKYQKVVIEFDEHPKSRRTRNSNPDLFEPNGITIAQAISAEQMKQTQQALPSIEIGEDPADMSTTSESSASDYSVGDQFLSKQALKPPAVSEVEVQVSEGRRPTIDFSDDLVVAKFNRKRAPSEISRMLQQKLTNKKQKKNESPRPIIKRSNTADNSEQVSPTKETVKVKRVGPTQ
jgi:hypothetical protein